MLVWPSAVSFKTTVNLVRSDLEFILQQILIAERHAAGEDLLSLLPNSQVPFGLRTVDGSFKSTPWGPSYFPNVPLTSQDGVTLRFYDDLLQGKAVAINLIFTSCTDECPLETARLAQVQRLLGDRVGKDLYFYSITIDPKRDTPSVLKSYAEKLRTTRATRSGGSGESTSKIVSAPSMRPWTVSFSTEPSTR